MPITRLTVDIQATTSSKATVEVADEAQTPACARIAFLVDDVAARVR